jgi:hypothetical protein
MVTNMTGSSSLRTSSGRQNLGNSQKLESLVEASEDSANSNTVLNVVSLILMP